MKKLLFIINPKAGKKKNKHHLDAAIEVFEKAGYKVGVKFTKKRYDGTLLAKEYGDRVDLVVCMGGDGTLNEVIQGMIEGDIKTPLGYIPAGSTNDFANSLGLKTNPKDQAEFIVSKTARPLDMGQFNGRYFVYTASAGIFTKTSYSTPQKLKNIFGHTAYVISGVKEVFNIKRLKLRIELEDEVIEGTYMFAAINNATKVGGIMNIDKDLVCFNDGLFELLLVEYPKNFPEFIKIARQILKQRFSGKISLTQITKAKITDSSDIDWSLDGEKENGQKIIVFNVIENAVNFIY